MNFKKSVEPAELALLAEKWGPVAAQKYRLDVDDPFLTGNHQLLTSDQRRAEICYVMHRGDPTQALLLHIKTYYPAGAYRLPTGGIHVGEPVEATLAREIQEETGLIVGAGADQVQVQRFLGVVAYELVHRTLQRTDYFATYAFLVQMPAEAALDPQDPEENIADWQWRPPADLPTIAATLENIGDSAPDWADWGRFRALSHRFVAERLISDA
ncbi:MAG: NUDIX hydrolase [Chloroflexi bacterium]|nr:NUDIX hydrolase [Chloroflexota bacterium]